MEVTVEVDDGAGEEGDAGEVMHGEDAGDEVVGTRPRAEDEDGTRGCHGKLVME